MPALPLARVARFPLGDLDRRACVAWRVEGAPRQCRKQPWCCPPGSCDASPYIVWSRRGSRCAASPRASGAAHSAGRGGRRRAAARFVSSALAALPHRPCLQSVAGSVELQRYFAMTAHAKSSMTARVWPACAERSCAGVRRPHASAAPSSWWAGRTAREYPAPTGTLQRKPCAGGACRLLPALLAERVAPTRLRWGATGARQRGPAVVAMFESTADVLRPSEGRCA